MNTYTPPSPYLSDQVYEQILGWINQQQIPPGSRIPSERSLAKHFNATRSAVRQALARLVAEGKIHARSPRIRVIAEQEGQQQKRSATISILTHIQAKTNSGITRSFISWMYHYGLLSALHDVGRSVLYIPPMPTAAEILRRIEAERPCGMMILADALEGAHAKAVIDLIRSISLPLCINADVLPKAIMQSLPCDSVAADHRQGCYMLTTWLIQQGRKRILRFWPDTTQIRQCAWVEARNAGYEQACAEHGITPLPPLWVPMIDGLPERERLDKQARINAGFLLDAFAGPQPVDAILVISDGMYFEVAAACRRLGRLPGKDVLICGYDNYWMELHDARIWEPSTPSATIDNRYTEIGRGMVDLLLARVADKLPSEPQCRLVKPELVVIAGQ